MSAAECVVCKTAEQKTEQSGNQVCPWYSFNASHDCCRYHLTSYAVPEQDLAGHGLQMLSMCACRLMFISIPLARQRQGRPWMSCVRLWVP